MYQHAGGRDKQDRKQRACGQEMGGRSNRTLLGGHPGHTSTNCQLSTLLTVCLCVCVCMNEWMCVYLHMNSLSSVDAPWTLVTWCLFRYNCFFWFGRHVIIIIRIIIIRMKEAPVLPYCCFRMWWCHARASLNEKCSVPKPSLLSTCPLNVKNTWHLRGCPGYTKPLKAFDDPGP